MRLPNERETTVSLKDVAPYSSVNSDDITNIDNAIEELENLDLNDITNGLNVQNENIERDDQEKLMKRNHQILILKLPQFQEDLLA